MNTSDLSLFVAVAQAGSFAAVARARDLDPSQVSRSIAGLERQLQTRLFERSTRQMALTEAGARYLDRIAPLLEDLDAAGAELRDTHTKPQGRLRLSTSVAFGQEMLVPILHLFRRDLPDLSLELIFTDANLDLVAEQIDLAIRLAPAPKGDLISRKLRPTTYHVVAPPDIAAQAPEDITDLPKLPLIIHAVPGLPRVWRFRAADGTETQVPVDGPLHISNALSLRDCVRRGLGVALLADWMVARDLANGRLVALYPDYAVTATSFDTAAWLLYPSRRYLPLKTRSVIDILTRRLGRSP
ncbi:MAG: LysR substrate-binding domain-containing protein [Pseudomonadota bacterium]